MLSQKKINEIFKGIYSGKIDIDNLPNELSAFTYNEIIKFVQQGFGDLTTEAKIAKMASYEKNISAFSGAKTFQEVKDLNSFVFNEEGIKRPFKEFRIFGQEINDTYNVDYLRTEQDTAFGMSQSANQWAEIQEDKDIFPMLQYQTVGDGRVRDEHAAWDGITRPVDDSFWDTRMRINDFNCRCTVIRLTEGKTTNLKEHLKEYNERNPTAKVKSLKNDSPMFNVNPGKVDYIYNEKKHPYFKHTKSEDKAFKEALKWQSKE